MIAQQLGAFSRYGLPLFALLEEKGLIVRQQGVGTRISQHLDYSLDDEEAGFTKLVLQAGGVAGNRWLERTTVLLPDEVASSVPALKGERVTKLRRVRLINGEPVSLETTWIPLDLLPAPEILEHSHQYWAERGIVPAKKKVRIKAIACQAETARLLNIQPGMPLLFYRQHTYNAQNSLLEYCEIYCRSDIYEIQVSD
ncbi:MAG: GntR family transcriptional regulator [Symbiopectobacterium sp.]|uniref:GntR family transcriptional regulator n=1 Tax=Symbiopectobacterium sp. TaxID=2952789 RepID=UPI0039EC694B